MTGEKLARGAQLRPMSLFLPWLALLLLLLQSPDIAQEIGPVVVMREWFACRYFHSQKGAERLPAFFYSIDQQLFRRNVLLDPLDMAQENTDGVIFVLEPVVKRPFPDECAHHVTMRSASVVGVEMRNAIDSAGDALVPLFGIAHRQQHFRIRINLHEFFVKSARGPVYRCLVPLENRGPVGSPSAHNGVPLLINVRFIEEFRHMVTGAKAQFFKRVFQRERPCSSKTGPDDLQPAIRAYCFRLLCHV